MNMEAGAAAAEPAGFFHKYPLYPSAVPEGAGGCHPMCQRIFVDEEPFEVILGDDVVYSGD